MKATDCAPREFWTWAKRTYGWQKGDIARLIREKPGELCGIVEYWRSTHAKSEEACPVCQEPVTTACLMTDEGRVHAECCGELPHVAKSTDEGDE